MSGRRQPEAAIQRAVFQHIRARGAGGLVAFHVPNGGARRPIEAAILKGLGVVAGAADVILLHRGRAFALELLVGALSQHRLGEGAEKGERGMSRRTTIKQPNFVATYRLTMKTPAWQALSVGAKAMLLVLASNYNTKAQNSVFCQRGTAERYSASTRIPPRNTSMNSNTTASSSW